MTVRKSKKKLNIYLSTIGAAVICAFVICVFIFESNKGTTVRDSYELETLSGWESEGEEMGFPYSFDARQGKELVVSNVLPDYIPENYALTFRTLYCECRVFVDGNQIAEYATETGMLFSRLTGNIRFIVPLSQNDAGKTITVSFTPYYTQKTDIAGFEFGTVGDIKLSIVYYNLLRFFTTTMMFTIAFVALIFVAYAVCEKSFLNVRLVYNFALFTFVDAMWIVCSSDIPQLFINKNGSASVVSYLCLSLMTPCFAGFSENLLPKGKKIFEKIRYISWGLPIINIFGMITGLFDPPTVLILTHVSILTVALFSLFYAVKAWNEGVEGKVLLLAIIELIVVAGVGFACYFIAPSRGYDGMVFGIGMLIFILILFVIIFVRQIKEIEESRYVEVYKELAFTDILTGLNNRAAFEREFSRISERGDRGVWISLFMFDLNFLKEVNDNYGHQAGDQLIVGMSECISDVFGRLGNCYRLGGDEFAAICINQKGKAEQLLKDFDEVLAEYNSKTERTISSARGYAELAYNGESNFMSLLFKLADQEMYIDKQIKHNNRVR